VPGMVFCLEIYVESTGFVISDAHRLSNGWILVPTKLFMK